MNFIKQFVATNFGDIKVRFIIECVIFSASVLTIFLMLDLSKYIAALAFFVSAIWYYHFCEGILDADEDSSF